MGVLGCLLVYILRNWNHLNRRWASLAMLSMVILLTLALGLLPYMNNWGNLGGLVSGILVGLMIAPYIDKVVRQHQRAFVWEARVAIDHLAHIWISALWGEGIRGGRSASCSSRWFGAWPWRSWRCAPWAASSTVSFAVGWRMRRSVRTDAAMQ
jgi:hypothetical protein